MLLKRTAWILFALFALAVGLYPSFYFLMDMSNGFLSSKPTELLKNNWWNSFFYLHIVFGGAALLTGWIQFSEKVRTRNPTLHRTLGKIYVATVLTSGLSGFYLALYSTGGMTTHFGFGILAFAWVFTTIKAYAAIRNKKVNSHQQWMIRSYALCFAAVTLRIWLPAFTFGLKIPFEESYKIISWLCWLPNLLVAELMIRKVARKRKLQSAFVQNAEA